MDQCFLTASFILWFWVPFAILLRSWLIFQPSSENMKGQHVEYDAVIRSLNWVGRRRRSWGQRSGWPYSVAFADLLVRKKIMEAGAPSENMKGQHVDDFFFCQPGSTHLTRDSITWPGRWPGRVSKLLSKLKGKPHKISKAYRPKWRSRNIQQSPPANRN
jgi:hypothetical protein